MDLIQKKELFNDVHQLNFVIRRSRREQISITNIRMGPESSRQIRQKLKNAYSFRSMLPKIHLTPTRDTSQVRQTLLLQENNSIQFKLKPQNTIFLSDQASIKSFCQQESSRISPNLAQIKNDSLLNNNTSMLFGTKQVALPQTQASFSEDYLQQIFMRLTQQPSDLKLHNLRLLRSQLRIHLLQRYSLKLVDRFLNFFQVPNSLDFPGFLQFREILVTITSFQWNYLFFSFYDQNDDRIICNSDLYRIYNEQVGINRMNPANESIRKDILKIYRFVKTGLNDMEQSDQQLIFLSRSIIMKQPNMNLSQLRECMKNKHKKMTNKQRDRMFLSNFGADEFFVNKNQDAFKGLKDIVVEGKPFHFAPEQPFSINFYHFQQIFKNNCPRIYRDILDYLGMGNQSDEKRQLQNDSIQISRSRSPTLTLSTNEIQQRPQDPQNFYRIIDILKRM